MSQLPLHGLTVVVRSLHCRNARAAASSKGAGGRERFGDFRMQEEGPASAARLARREALLSAAALLLVGSPDRTPAVQLPQTQIESQGAGGAGLKTLSNTGV
eukprot:3108240-Rhodomonas_salina.2